MIARGIMLPAYRLRSDEEHSEVPLRTSEVEVKTDAEPLRMSSIKLPVRRRAGEILREQLQLAISYTCIFKPKTRQDGLCDGPIRALIDLKIRVADWTDGAVEK